MKLNYKVLWLDDKIEELFIDDEYDVALRDYLIELGFNPTIDTVSDQGDFFEKLDQSYDLILTDYHLKNNTSETRDGDQIVKEVREKSIFTEILFYSAQGAVKETHKLDRITFLETKRLSGSHQDVLFDHTKKLIDLTVKKFQHIVAMRGMIMHETSSLDALMLQIIQDSIAKGEIDFNEMAESIYDDLIKMLMRKVDAVEACKTKKNFKTLTKDNFIFSASYKIKTLSQILTSLELEDFSKDYEVNINTMRNKFAHAVLQTDNKGVEYFNDGESGMKFDETLCKQIRKNINMHAKNLENLNAQLR
jgi:CheY-like chemotaxis protein